MASRPGGHRAIVVTSVGAAAIVLAAAAQPSEQTKAVGQRVFAARCAQCHDTGAEGAPARSELADAPADFVVAALTTGPMRPMAAGLTPGEIAAVASYITGKSPVARTSKSAVVGQLEAKRPGPSKA